MLCRAREASPLPVAAWYVQIADAYTYVYKHYALPHRYAGTSPQLTSMVPYDRAAMLLHAGTTTM